MQIGIPSQTLDYSISELNKKAENCSKEEWGRPTDVVIFRKLLKFRDFGICKTVVE